MVNMADMVYSGHDGEDLSMAYGAYDDADAVGELYRWYYYLIHFHLYLYHYYLHY